MGIKIIEINSVCEDKDVIIESKKQVFLLARKCIENMKGLENQCFSHVLVATSCPDSIAPSLGQSLTENYPELFSRSQVIDIVQGCSGGTSALLLGSQLAEQCKRSVLVIACDAAKKSTSSKSNIYKHFNNGAFGCLIKFTDEDQFKLIHHRTEHFKGLSDVVKIGLGHDADQIIGSDKNVMEDPRNSLGLKMDGVLALRLLKKAENFYVDFIKESCSPDILILHQPNQEIVNMLEKIFIKYKVDFINHAKQIGNCGAATTGILLDQIKENVKGKKVMICGFGTGGVITAGLWQF